MVGMRGWSFPIGRFLGVDVRIHTFFLLLLGLSISYASVAGATGGRGFVLWLLLLLAVVVREVARAVGAAWFGLDLRSILLLPTGGLFSYASSEATEKAETSEMQKRMSVIGPIANIGFGLLLAAPLDGGRVFRGEFAKAKGGIKSSRAAMGLGPAIAVVLMIIGFLIPNMWLI